MQMIYPHNSDFSCRLIDNFQNRYNVYQLELVTESNRINDSRMQDLVDNLKDDLTENFLTLINETYDRLTGPVQVMKESITKPVDDVIVKLKELKQDLHDYQVSTLMDADFFMWAFRINNISKQLMNQICLY